jgi:ribosomal protein S19
MKLSYFIKTSDVGKTVSLVNGKTAFSLFVTEMMLGYRFGQFLLTKKLGSSIHIKKKQRKKRK